MLANAPREAAIEMLPSLDLQPLEVAALVDQLDDYHAIYSPLFQRREQRQHSGEYLRGLLLDIVSGRVLHPVPPMTRTRRTGWIR